MAAVLAALLAAVGASTLSWQQTSGHAASYISRAARLGRFNGVVLIANGSNVYRAAFGYADMTRHVRNTIHTQFEIASISKMFTALAILKLRDEGRLQLTDSVCKYLTACPPAWQPVTIDEALHHRSGIPDYESALEIESPQYYAFLTAPDDAARILEREKPLPLDFAPGTKFSYSNTGYIALGFIIEAASGMTYATYVHSRILDPAGMEESGILHVDAAPRLATGYAAPDVTWAQRLAGFTFDTAGTKPVPQLALTSPHGDASLFSTAGDLLRWGRIMLGTSAPSILSERERREILTAQEGYGDGWMIDEAFGKERYRHTGELPGFLSNIALYPQSGTIVIMLDNVDTPMSAVARDFNAASLGQPYDPPVSGTQIDITTEQMNAVSGQYKRDNGDLVCVAPGRPFLKASVTGKFAAGLIPLAPDRFYMPLSSGVVTFSGDAMNMRYDGQDHRAARTGTTCSQYL